MVQDEAGCRASAATLPELAAMPVLHTASSPNLARLWVSPEEYKDQG